MANLGANVPVQRSGQDIIKSSHRLVGSLRSGQNMSAAELSDSLLVAQDMLDAWSAERLMVFAAPYTTVDQNGVTLSFKASQQKYVLGNALGTEDFKLPRPQRIDNVSVLYSASQSTPVEIALDMYDAKQWQAIPNKSTPSLLPQVCYVEPTVDGLDWLMYIWPIPTQANPMVLYPWSALQQFPNLQTRLAFPPAYSKAIRYNLAMDFAAEFGCDLTKIQLVQKGANESKGVVKAINQALVVPEVWVDEALIGSHARGNIFAGGPNRGNRGY